MSVAVRRFDLDESRKSVQAMSDEDLIKEGKKMRWLSGDRKIVSTMPCAFYEQLKFVGGMAKTAFEMMLALPFQDRALRIMQGTCLFLVRCTVRFK